MRRTEQRGELPVAAAAVVVQVAVTAAADTIPAVVAAAVGTLLVGAVAVLAALVADMEQPICVPECKVLAYRCRT